MKIIGLDIADVCTLSVYLAGITVLGVWMGKTVRNTTDFFVGGRRFGKLFSTFFAFGAGTHSDQAVSVAAKTYKTGMSGIWYQWLWLFVTPFYWLIAPIQRRCRAITTGDYFEARYARSVAMLFVVVGIFNLMVNIGTMLKGSGAVIGATTGNELSEGWAIALMTILFVTYGVVGGFAAAVVTDFVQGLLTIVFSFMLVPIAIKTLGGFSGLHAGVAATFQEHAAPGVSEADAMWSLAPGGGGASEITLFYVVVIMINALVGIVAQPHSLPGANASKTEREAQIGAVTGNMIKRLCTVAWCLLGMCAFVMFRGMTEDREIDQAFGLVAHKLLPQVLPGLIGIFIASLLASIMSSCDAFMITCSGLFTQNLYRPLTGGRQPESHYVNVGRVAAAAVVAGGVFFAYTFESVLKGLELFWKLSAMMGIAFWAGLFWRRATTAGAWAGTLIAFAAMLFTSEIKPGGWEIWSFNKRVANASLFSMAPEFERDLNDKDKSISEKLRGEFAGHGVELPEKPALAAVEKQEIGRRWLIRDDGQWYTLIRDNQERKENVTIDAHANRLLFDTTLAVQKELNAGGASDDLRAEFDKAGVHLSSSAGIFAMDAKGGKWLIRDGGRRYTVIRAEDTLHVYENALRFRLQVHTKGLLFWRTARYERDLDNREGTISEELREEFADRGVALSPSATIALGKTEKTGCRWLISGDERCYTVIKATKANRLDAYANALPLWMLWKGELRLPWQMIIYLSAGIAGLVVVSLVTRPPAAGQLDRFYGVLRTPVTPGEVIRAPLTLPEGVEPAPQNKLIDRPNWEIQIPTRRGIVGFLVVAAVAAALVASVVLLVRIGA